MPILLDLTFNEQFVRDGDELIAIVRRHLTSWYPLLKEVEVWLNDNFSEESTRQQWQPRRVSYIAQQCAQLDPIPYWITPGDKLRADRLEKAIETLCGENQRNDLVRLLGPHLPQSDRQRNALRAVVVCVCVLSADAGELFTDITPLANTPWLDDHTTDPPIKGRATVKFMHGREALKLLREAIGVLGWEKTSTAQHNARSHEPDRLRQPDESSVQLAQQAELKPSSKSTGWRDVQRRLCQLYECGEAYTTVRDLAQRLQCSSSTIYKAMKPGQGALSKLSIPERRDINATATKLTGWKARKGEQKNSVRAKSLTDPVLKREEAVSPSGFLPPEDVDKAMQHLIDEAGPHDKAILNALNDEGLQLIAEAYYRLDHDLEPSPLEKDAPGTKRVVREYKKL